MQTQTHHQTPPTVTSIELARRPPFVRLVERREQRREKAVAAGFFALTTAVGLWAAAPAVAVVTAALAGYCGHGWRTWDERYVDPEVSV